MTTWLVLYVMLWPSDPPVIRSVPMSRPTCEALARRVQRLIWPMNECMPADWKPAGPPPWEAREVDASLRMCTPTAETDCG